MKTTKTIILIAVLTLLGGCGNVANQLSGDAKPQVGDTVVFKASDVAYNEGKIEKIEGGKYEIRSGNNIAKADAADVYTVPKAGARSDVKAGDIVVAFSREIYWSGGEVKNVTADVVEVEAVSGGKLNVAHDKIIKVSPTAVADIKQSIEKKGFEDTGKAKKPVLPKDWKPKKGEKVAAQWSFGTWHVAVIKNVNKNNVDIDWQNGWSDGSVTLDKIAPYPTAENAMPKAGDYVIVKPQSDIAEWKFATVTAINGQEADVKFADGKTQKIKNTDFIGLS
jgi:hypothetical protein